MNYGDEEEIGFDGFVSEGPPGGLEALLSAKAIISEPVRIEREGETVEVVFRELSNDMKQKCKMHALQYIEDKRRAQEEDGKGIWRDVDSDLDVLKGEETDLRMLQAAMLDPKTKGPACSLGWLRKRMGTQLQTALGEKYAAFEQLINPSEVTTELIELVIDDVKKKMQPDFLLMQYESTTLISCIMYLVDQLSSYQTDKSTGLESGETKP